MLSANVNHIGWASMYQFRAKNIPFEARHAHIEKVKAYKNELCFNNVRSFPKFS